MFNYESDQDSTYLEARAAGQASPQLHKSTGHLVAHGSMALVVVNRSGGTPNTMVTGSLGGGSGSCGGVRSAAGGSASSTLGSEKSGLQTRTSGACGAGSSSMVGTGSAGS